LFLSKRSKNISGFLLTILAEFRGKDRSLYYSAICPICFISYDVNISSARALAVKKVASHINSAHSDALT